MAKKEKTIDEIFAALDKRKKAKKPPIIVNGEVLDSMEEHAFYHWCIEAEKYGWIKRFWYHPPAFKLAEAVQYKKLDPKNNKVKFAALLRDVEYFPDFLLIFDADKMEDFLGKFPGSFIIGTGDKHDDEVFIYVDVKGLFSGQHNVSASTFPVKRAWVYQKFGVYIQKVIPQSKKTNGIVKEKGFFAKTWCPLESYFMKSRKVPTVYAEWMDCKLITEL